MKLVPESIALADLKGIAEAGFGTMVKAVVDVAAGIMAVDAELHSDEEAMLLANGSAQRDLWGINLYPDVDGDDWIEFDSMINLRRAKDDKMSGPQGPWDPSSLVWSAVESKRFPGDPSSLRFSE